MLMTCRASRINPLTIGALLVCVLLGPVGAQPLPGAGSGPAPPGVDTPADSDTLAPMVVTARKFAEPLQQVPFGLTVVSHSDMQNRQIQTSQDLYRWVPNFQFSDTGLPFSSLLNIRGLGSSSALISPSVNYYVDGVPVPSRVADFRFLDLERLEVLRGPQGTLFGLNAQAGVVNLITTEPGTPFGGEVGLAGGSFGHKQLSLTLGGAPTSGLAARFAGHVYDDKGNIQNVIFASPTTIKEVERDVRSEFTGGLRGKVLFTPNEALRITTAMHYRHTRQRPTTGVLLDDPEFPRHAFNPIPEDRTQTAGVGLTLEWRFDWGRLTTISGYQYYDLGLKADILDGFIANAQTGLPPFAFQPPGLNVRTIDERNTQWTQEIRLDGVTPGGIRWLGGFNLLYADFVSTTDIVSQQLANGAYTGAMKTTNLAGFGEVTVPLLEHLRAIVGLRYTHEHKTFDGVFRGRPGRAPAASLFAEEGETTDNFVTGRIGLSFDVMPTLTAFATVARGEKPGGFLFFNQFAAQRVALQPFQSAATWAYEVGLRGRPLGPWLEVSTSLFYNDTQDEQLFSFNPLAGRFDVVNGDTETYGAEVEVRARPVTGLTLGGTLALLKTEITHGSAASQPLVGNEVPYAPRLTASLLVDYRHPVPLLTLRGEAFGDVEWQHVDRRDIDPANSRRLAAYNLVHLRAGWQSQTVDVYAFVNNVFNEDYVSTGFRAGQTAAGVPVFGGVPGAPRTAGLGMRLRF